MIPKFAHSIDPIILNVLGVLDRIENSDSPSRDDVQLRLRALIDEADARLGSGKEWKLAKYALVCWIDEMLVDAPWEGREWWNNNVMEQTLFNTRNRHQQFFTWAQEAAELTEKNALEVYYVCVILGFRGLYHDPSSAGPIAESLGLPADLNVWAKQTALSIRLGQHLPPLAPPGPEIQGARPLRRASSVVWPWLTSLMLVVAAILFYYYEIRP